MKPFILSTLISGITYYFVGFILSTFDFIGLFTFVPILTIFSITSSFVSFIVTKNKSIMVGCLAGLIFCMLLIAVLQRYGLSIYF